MIPKKKIVNDPIYGLISIPGGIIFDLIEHPYFQRLRRIKQLGLSHLIFPGAVHSRFQHVIGAMHLINLAIEVIRNKGHIITAEEEEATKIAILLHDIGHGPFSHALERNIITNISHEDISLFFMHELNKEFDGKLDLAIKIFKNNYSKKFLHQLISSQLDMDRLDYLKRDSFFTGVVEGVVASERIIKMLQVVNDNLVVESKGIYSIEKFLIARRLMYWQVYLHKTVIVAEKQLGKILLRIKDLNKSIGFKTGNRYFDFFLDEENLNKEVNIIIENFSKLDDYDIIGILKNCRDSEDPILSTLSENLLNRKLPKIIVSKRKFKDSDLNSLGKKMIKKYNITKEELKYFVYSGKVSNHTYSPDKADEKINILYGGQLMDISKASDILNLSVLSKNVKKHYIIAPKDIINSENN